MGDANKDMGDFKLFKPKKAGESFINFYISNYRNEKRKPEIEKVSESISRMGLDRVLEMYSQMEKELQQNVKTENYEMAAEVKKAMDYFKEHVIDKAPRP